MKTKHTKLPALSVFFPAYNEAGNIALVVHQALAVLPRIAKKFEIIVIDDGSTDETFKIAQKLSKQHSKVKAVTQPNKGYGGALKRGFAEAQYEWIFFTDSDLQFDLSELEKFLAYATNHELVIGYRHKRVEGWKRQVFAEALKLWNRLILQFPNHIRDIDCAFKLIHRSVIKEIEPLLSEGAMISTEMLLKAYHHGFNIHQQGVNHYPRYQGSPTGNKFQVIYRAVTETLLLKRDLKKQLLKNTLSISS